jgi:hypothetical protein
VEVKDRPGPGHGEASCPDAERLAEYVDGGLPPRGREEIEAHLANCSDCRAVVAETTEFVRTDRAAAPHWQETSSPVTKFNRRRVVGVAGVLAAAAALVFFIRVTRPELVFGPRSDRPELAELIAALANQPDRVIEGRLTGGFRYGPPPPTTRGSGDRAVSPDVRIAATKLEALAKEREAPEQLAALGVAYLALGDDDKAIETLDAVVRQRPGDFRFESDLSAAYLARARRIGRPDDWSRALAAAERALKENPRAVEASFNRALALDGLQQDAAASEAWTTYEQLDRSPGWSAEAAERANQARARARPVPRDAPRPPAMP